MSEIKDLTGLQFGQLMVIKQVPRPENRKSTGTYWECLCECGNKIILSRRSLISKGVKTCGCFSRIKNLTGQKFSRLTALYPINSSTTHKQWHCKCDCGNECNVESSRLISGTTKSCGCLKMETAMNNIKKISGWNKKDIIGLRFGKLIVLEETEERKNEQLMYKCKCDCGKIHFVSSKHLLQGQIQSCGCGNSKGEDKIKQILEEQQIVFNTQQTFPDLLSCKNWKLRFDFYLPEIKTCIEFQGSQHYNPQSYFYSLDLINNDILKREYCKKNKLKLIEIPYTDYDKINWVYLKEKLYD